MDRDAFFLSKDLRIISNDILLCDYCKTKAASCIIKIYSFVKSSNIPEANHFTIYLERAINPYSFF